MKYDVIIQRLAELEARLAAVEAKLDVGEQDDIRDDLRTAIAAFGELRQL